MQAACLNEWGRFLDFSSGAWEKYLFWIFTTLFSYAMIRTINNIADNTRAMLVLESNMIKQNFAVEYAYVSFTSYYYYGGKAGLSFTAKGR